MVDEKRSRYVGGSEGAPPLPPPGGYQGARRSGTALDAAAGLPAAPASITHTDETTKHPTSGLGLAAIIAASLFAVTLLILLIGGGTDLMYGVSLLVVQLLVIGVVIAAIVSRRARMLGAIALVIALLFNLATIGAIGTVQAAARHDYEGTKSDEQKHEEAYPGIRGVPSSDILAQPSQEAVQAEGDALMADIRERITERFGYTWVKAGDGDVSPERNGFGGESMLSKYTSPTWTTAEPIQDNARKREVLAAAEDVLYEHGMLGFYVLNSADSGISEDMVAKLYGSADVEAQHTWEWYSDTYPEPLRFYANVYDLSKDPTGEFRLQREAQNAQTGEPLEGLQLMVYAPQLLSEDDRAEFEKRLEEYPDLF